MSTFKIALHVLLLAIITTAIPGERRVVLPEINRADSLHVDGSRFYITEGPQVFIYSLEDFNRIKTFGKRGEGPGEFKIPDTEPLHINVQSEHILIDCFGKVLFYSKRGEFIKEFRTRFPVPTYMVPLGENKYVAWGYKQKSDRAKDQRIFAGSDRMLTVNLLDESFKKMKEITHIIDRPLVFCDGNWDFKVHEGRIFVTFGEGEFLIKCFDSEGNLKYSIINEEFKRKPVTEADRERSYQWVKKNWHWTAPIEKIKKILKFPEYWRAIEDFFVTGDTIYIKTSRREGEKDLFYLYNLNGKYVTRVFIPFTEKEILHAGPYTIYNRTLYRLVQTESEDWELRIRDISAEGGGS